MKCIHCGSEWNVSPGLSVSITNCPFCGKSLLPEKKQLNTVEDVLVEINRLFGVSVLADETKLVAYFSDLAPQLSRQRRILGYFVECGGPRKIVSALNASDDEQSVCIKQIVREMKDEMYIEEAASQMICESFLFAISGRRVNEVSTVSAPKASLTSVNPATSLQAGKEEMSAEEQYQKGEAYFNGVKSGNSISKDYSKAFEWYQKAALRGHPLAQCQLGLLYREGHGIPKDEKQAFEWFMKAAQTDQNCPRGKFYVGRCYERGTGISRNLAEAIRWYSIAAEQGDAYAQINLGLCYKFGDGVQQNFSEAVRLFTMAATEGDALALCNLGLLYKEGKGVPKDVDVALDLISKSANQGEPYGQLELGYWYWRGDVCKRNPSQAFSWFQKAAEQGDEEAQERLGYCYEKGEGIDHNPAQAIYWYEKAANGGLASAMTILGDCYKVGSCVSQSYEKAALWYQKAVGQGHAQAMLDLGDLYSEGLGVPQNMDRALELYEAAFNKGNMFGLAHVFIEYGSKEKLTPAECKKVISLTQRIASVTNKPADELFELFIVGLYPDSCINVALDLVSYTATKATGIGWITKCADAGSARAQLWLGESYRLGDDLPKDKEKAIYWYEKAAAQGDKDAKERLKLLKKGIWSYLFS